MIIMETKVYVAGLSGREVTDFMLNPSDENYRRWWNGTHLEFHLLKSRPGHVGDVVYMDEFIGRHRVKMKGVVVEAVPGELIVWQFKKMIKLPGRLFLKLKDDKEGVRITHTITIGFGGIGKILDPIFRLFFHKDFEEAMEEHARIEFNKLREVLH
ncbi:MAG: hypothetical protein JW984_16005 [Deltaproteobacteria bacterium]|uniref:SRPBCC family protein n=1 Tax=Candidatus Zymogenus saltonus TaxID=2844893 RepID=A0A9D8KHV1_9DELT|nr:hypothetical protein [Candidatus Zymogenus saltonus]